MEKENAYLYLILVAALWGTQSPLLKILSGDVSPSLLNLLRFSMAGLALLPFVLRRRIKIEKNDLLGISFLGLVGIFLYSIINIVGIRLSTAINNVVLINSWPLMLALAAFLLGREKVTAKSLAGVAIGFAGVVVVMINGVGIESLMRSEYFAGNLLILLSALCFMAYSMFSKAYIGKYGGLAVTFYAVAAGAAALFASSIASQDILGLASLGTGSFLLLLWIAVPTTALAWVIWFTGVGKIGAVRTGSFFLLTPVFGIIYSSALLGEQVTLFTVVGTALILLGIRLVQISAKG